MKKSQPQRSEIPSETIDQKLVHSLSEICPHCGGGSKSDYHESSCSRKQPAVSNEFVEEGCEHFTAGAATSEHEHKFDSDGGRCQCGETVSELLAATSEAYASRRDEIRKSLKPSLDAIKDSQNMNEPAATSEPPYCAKATEDKQEWTYDYNCGYWSIMDGDKHVGIAMTERSAKDITDAHNAAVDADRASDKRAYDLIRFCRSELHEAKLISDDEYAMITAWGSKSARRLEAYDDIEQQLLQALAAIEKIAKGDTLDAAKMQIIAKSIDATALAEHDAAKYKIIASLHETCENYEDRMLRSEEQPALVKQYEGAAHHMEACRALLGVPEDEVLYVAIEELKTKAAMVKPLVEALEHIRDETAEPNSPSWKAADAALAKMKEGKPDPYVEYCKDEAQP